MKSQQPINVGGGDININVKCLNSCLCFTSLQQRGHLEKAPPFTVPCEGREAR